MKCKQSSSIKWSLVLQWTYGYIKDVLSYIAGGSSVLSKSVPEGFPVVASSTLRPLICLALFGRWPPDLGFYEEVVHQHTCHSVQLVRFVLRPRVALFWQVMIGRAWWGRDVTGGRTAVALAWPSTSCTIKAKVGRYYWAGKSPGRML